MTSSNRTKGTVRELNTPKEKLRQVNELMSCDKAPYFKKTAIRRILGHTFCAECHEIPSLEISYAEFDIIRIEHYCTNCYQKSLARSLEEPQTREEIAEFYGCIKAEQK